MNGDVAPSPEPTGGTVKYYDGIAFNDVTDVDQYGRIKVDKLKEFLLKLADQLRFVKETENIILNAHIQKYQKDISGVLV